MDLSVFRNISYGMYVLGANDNGRYTGCIINTVIQITNEEPKIAISLNHDNYTYEVIKRERKFSISIIPEEVDPDVIKVFGFQTGKNTDKFSCFAHDSAEQLPIFSNNFCGSLACEVLEMVDCGTHDVIIAKVLCTAAGNTQKPMTYAYYHNVIKGRAPKNAPTYQSENIKDKSDAYVCELCGYVYEGDITKEPDGYCCPVCGAPKTLFKKL